MRPCFPYLFYINTCYLLCVWLQSVLRWFLTVSWLPTVYSTYVRNVYCIISLFFIQNNFNGNFVLYLRAWATVFGPNQLPMALPSETPIWANLEKGWIYNNEVVYGIRHCYTVPVSSQKMHDLLSALHPSTHTSMYNTGAGCTNPG